MIIIEDNYKYTDDLDTPSVSSYYATGYSRSRKAHFEGKSSFRRGFSRYEIKSHRITAGTDCKWDNVNCSGVPVDYDATQKILYVDGSDAHTLLIGATGSKKSRLVVMPSVHTIAAAGEGMVICDPKGEIYERTAYYLDRLGYHIHFINLREPQEGDGWNMLEIPYKLFLAGEVDKACGMINDASISLMPIASRDPYWDYSARDMLFGLTLLLFQLSMDMNQPPETVNMMSVLKLRDELFCSSNTAAIKNTNIWKYAKNFEQIRMRLTGIIVCPERTLSCILSTFDQHMSCFVLQPTVTDLLSRSTFDLNKFGFTKTAVFLIMPDEKTTYHKIITIFLKQIYEFLIDSAFKHTGRNRFPVRVNFILDEFSSLPQISDFPQMVSASRSRNIRFILVIQSKHQLIQRYQDEADTIISNCTNWLFLTSRETKLLQEISELAGTTGTNHEHLISVSWLQHLDKEKGECLVFSGRKYPYLATLPDIDLYDGAQYEILGTKFRDKADFDEDYHSDTYFGNLLRESSKLPCSQELEPVSLDDLFNDLPNPNPETMQRKAELDDIQKELEAKFDELFGSPDDNDEES